MRCCIFCLDLSYKISELFAECRSTRRMLGKRNQKPTIKTKPTLINVWVSYVNIFRVYYVLSIFDLKNLNLLIKKVKTPLSASNFACNLTLELTFSRCHPSVPLYQSNECTIKMADPIK